MYHAYVSKQTLYNNPYKLLYRPYIWESYMHKKIAPLVSHNFELNGSHTKYGTSFLNVSLHRMQQQFSFRSAAKQNDSV